MGWIFTFLKNNFILFVFSLLSQLLIIIIWYLIDIFTFRLCSNSLWSFPPASPALLRMKTRFSACAVHADNYRDLNRRGIPCCESDRCMLTEWKSSVLSVNLTPSWRCQSAGEHARYAARQDEWENLRQRDRTHAALRESETQRCWGRNCTAKLTTGPGNYNRKMPFIISTCRRPFF